MLSGAWPRVLADGTVIADLAEPEAGAAVDHLIAELVAAQEAAGIGLLWMLGVAAWG